MNYPFNHAPLVTFILEALNRAISGDNVVCTNTLYKGVECQHCIATFEHGSGRYSVVRVRDVDNNGTINYTMNMGSLWPHGRNTYTTTISTGLIATSVTINTPSRDGTSYIFNDGVPSKFVHLYIYRSPKFQNSNGGLTILDTFLGNYTIVMELPGDNNGDDVENYTVTVRGHDYGISSITEVGKNPEGYMTFYVTERASSPANTSYAYTIHRRSQFRETTYDIATISNIITGESAYNYDSINIPTIDELKVNYSCGETIDLRALQVTATLSAGGGIVELVSGENILDNKTTLSIPPGTVFDTPGEYTQVITTYDSERYEYTTSYPIWVSEPLEELEE